MLNYKLKQHQKEGVKFLLEHHYSILGDGMGLGKTLQAIEVIKRTNAKALVICPAMLVGTWEAEIRKFSELMPIRVKDYKALEQNQVGISSYSRLKNLEDMFKEVDLIILDEAHYVKNPEAQRTQNLHHYVSTWMPERLVMLTGTAIKNRVTEFYSLLALCSYSPESTNGINVLSKYPDYYQFANTFCYRTEFRVKGRNVVKFEGSRNLDELITLLNGKYLRRKASQVLDLPPITRKDVILEPEKVDFDLMQAWESQNTRGSFMKSKVNSAMVKVPHTVRYAKDLLDQGEGPLLIFTDHVDPAKDIGKRLGFAVITGQVNTHTRDKLVGEFQQGKLKGLVATIGSLSVGVTLTAATNLIFNDLSFVPGDIAQAEKRIHRIGQEGHCTIHRILWGKVDLHICRELDKKIEVLGEVL